MTDREQAGLVAMGLTGAGVLGALLARNPKLLTNAINKTKSGTKKATQKVIGPWMTYVQPPGSYTLSGQVGAATKALRHPLATARSIRSQTPIWDSDEHIYTLAIKGPKGYAEGGLLGLLPRIDKNIIKKSNLRDKVMDDTTGFGKYISGKNTEEKIRRLNHRLPLWRRGWGQKPLPKGHRLEKFEDLYISNPDGTMSFNPANAQGKKYIQETKRISAMDKYYKDKGVKVVTPDAMGQKSQREFFELRNKFKNTGELSAKELQDMKDGKYGTLGKWFQKVAVHGNRSSQEYLKWTGMNIIDNEAMLPYHKLTGGFGRDFDKNLWWDDWDFALNKGEQPRSKILKNLWKGTRDPYYLEKGIDGMELLKHLGKYNLRKVLSKGMDPVRLTGNLDDLPIYNPHEIVKDRWGL